MDRQQLLKRLDTTWTALKASYAGLSDAQLTQTGVTDGWSVKDTLAHIATWEEETLKHLPHIVAGGRPPTYATAYGGVDAFNAQMTDQKRSLSLVEVQRHLDDTHRRLIAYIHGVPEEHFTRETRFRRRLRLDTYGHYPIHARMIQDWRENA